MRTDLAIRVSDYVRENKEVFSSRLETWDQMAKRTSDQLGFEVKATQLRDVCKANNIETRRIAESKREKLCLLAENERLEDSNRSLKNILAKVAASEFIPEDLREYILAGLPQEMREALAMKS
jgi:hypothetical protein